jgi:FkbM family methyltransferase
MNLLELLQAIVLHPLNRSNRAAGIGRYARWQIASRLMPTKIALPFVDGFYLLAKNGMKGATQNWYFGLQEHREMGFVLHMLRDDDLFVDVGANIGSYSILACAAGANVISVEPVPTTFEHLRANVILNELSDRIELLCRGVSSATGVLRFSSDDDTMNRVLLIDEAAPSVTVQVRTLDEICAQRKPRIIKIDVEGHEAAVLKGGSRVLDDPSLDAVIMETNASGEKYGIADDILFDAMQSHGFGACAYDPILRRLSPAAKGSLNTIFVRDIQKSERQCSEAKRYSLCNGEI